MKQVLQYFLLTGLLVFAGRSFAVAQDAYDRYELVSLQQQQDYEGAIKYLQQFTAAYAGTPIYVTDLGYSYYQNNQYAEARTWLERALKLNPVYAPALLYLAQLNYEEKDFAESLGYYKKLLQLYPGRWRFHQQAATVFLQMGYADSAAKYLQEAYRLNPQAGTALLGLTDVLVRQNKIQQADSLLTVFLSRDTTDRNVIARKTELAFKLEKKEEVVRWGETLLRDSVYVTDPFIYLSAVYIAQQRYQDAIGVCEWLLTTNRAGQSVFYYAALGYAGLNDREQSNRLLSLCVRMSLKEDAIVYWNAQAENYIALKQYNTAIACHDSAWYVFQRPVHLYAAGYIAEMYLKDNRKAALYYRRFKKFAGAGKEMPDEKLLRYVDAWLRVHP
ncbi:tetratricopeptide repeat protein [Terrimonas ferruginea]|uniref:tetratricopeptide repeat protein n=1 Tax=Terrimonas ferruginea TaxID=249 RepID=UPI000411E13D|nr:tetratricopeptide repeat protein [Terrimonas ferruginea]